MPTIKEAQKMVRELEDEKGFSSAISDKIIWMAEELGELCNAYKHNAHRFCSIKVYKVSF